MVVGQNETESSQENSTFTSRSGSSNGIFAEYHHKDHLGNVRVAFTDRNDDQFVTLLGTANDIEVTQQLDYYPFGLQQQGDGLFHTQQEPGNRYRFNGKEVVEEVGLMDYGARWYDPAIARWSAVDPLADKYEPFSPYAYVANRPLNMVDPDGMSISSGANGVTLTGSDAQNFFRQLQNQFGGQNSTGGGKTTETYKRKVTYDLDGTSRYHGFHEVQTWAHEIYNEDGDILRVKTVTKESRFVLDEYGNIVKSWTGTDTDEIFYTIHDVQEAGGSIKIKSEVSRISSSTLEEGVGVSALSLEARREVLGHQAALDLYGNRWNPYNGDKGLANRSFVYGTVGAISNADKRLKVLYGLGLGLGHYYRRNANHGGRSSTILQEVKTKTY